MVVHILTGTMRVTEFERTIETLEFPTTTQAITSQYGAQELHFQEGSERLARVFERFGPEVFASADEVRMTLYGALPEAAVGRKGYTDRDPPAVGEVEPLSF